MTVSLIISLENILEIKLQGWIAYINFQLNFLKPNFKVIIKHFKNRCRKKSEIFSCSPWNQLFRMYPSSPFVCIYKYMKTHKADLVLVLNEMIQYILLCSLPFTYYFFKLFLSYTHKSTDTHTHFSAQYRSTLST